MYDIVDKDAIEHEIQMLCKQIYMYIYIKLYDLFVFEVDQSAVLWLLKALIGHNKLIVSKIDGEMMKKINNKLPVHLQKL